MQERREEKKPPPVCLYNTTLSICVSPFRNLFISNQDFQIRSRAKPPQTDYSHSKTPPSNMTNTRRQLDPLGDAAHMLCKIDGEISHNFLWRGYSPADRLIRAMAATAPDPCRPHNTGTPSTGRDRDQRDPNSDTWVPLTGQNPLIPITSDNEKGYVSL